MLRFLLFYPATGLALAAALVVLLRGRIPLWAGLLVGAFGAVAFVAWALAEPGGGQDVTIFWRGGRAVREGANPYADGFIAAPPPALPLLALLALPPLSVTIWLWKALNILGCLLLAAVARRALKSQEPGWDLPLPAAGVLAAVVVLSFPARYGLELGQMSVFAVLCLLTALDLQGRGRPVWAGVVLALASYKAATLLPFLLLFVRKKDWPAWLALAAAGLGLALIATPPADLLGRCNRCLHNIAHLGRAGGFNDYSYANPSSPEIFGLDHALYRLGLRDRGIIAAVQLASLGLLAVLLVWLQTRKPGLPRGAACAVVACYSGLFLYHRVYDMVVLVLPAAYCAGRVASGRGAVKALHSAAGLAVLGVLYLRLTTLREMTRAAAANPDAGGLVHALVLPCGTWLLLAAMTALLAAQFVRPRQAGAAETLSEVPRATRRLAAVH